MITIRTKNLSPLFKDLLGLRKFLESFGDQEISLVTSPEDGNELDLSGAIPDDIEIFSLIPHITGADETIEFHKYSLGLKKRITPLFPARGRYKEMKDYTGCGLYDVSGVEDIIEFESETGRNPWVIRLSINPLEYPKDIISYCKEQGIKIIGTDIFGGNLFTGYLTEMFPESFLQAFGEHNTDYIELPGDPYLIKRVESRLGKGLDNKKLLEYSKEIHRLPALRHPKRKIHQVLDIDVNGMGYLKLPGDEKGVFSLKPQTPLVDFKGEPIWEDTDIPEDIPEDNIGMLEALHRYHSLPKMDELYNPRVWKKVYEKVHPDFWIIKVIPKSWMGWFWGEHVYWLISGKLWKMPSGRRNFLINE